MPEVGQVMGAVTKRKETQMKGVSERMNHPQTRHHHNSENKRNKGLQWQSLCRIERHVTFLVQEQNDILTDF